MIYAFQALESMAFHSKISCLQNRVVSHSGKLLHRVCILWNMPNREKVFASSGVAARVTTFRHEKQLRTEPQSAGCWSNASCPSKHRTANLRSRAERTNSARVQANRKPILSRARSLALSRERTQQSKLCSLTTSQSPAMFSTLFPEGAQYINPEPLPL